MANKKKSTMPTKGFILDLVKTLVQRIGADKGFCTFTAERFLSGFCYKINTATNKGELPLSLWGLGVLWSGEYKTLVIGKWEGKILSKVEAMLPFKQKIRPPSRFSPEGMIEAMTWHKESFYNKDTEEEEEYWTIRNVGLLIRDEFTSMVTGVKDKKWMSGTNELLSEIYDLSIQPYYTKKSKLQNVDYCNVAFLSATTPLIYKLITEDQFIQGLFNRLDFCVLEPKEEIPEEENPDEVFSAQNVDEIELIKDGFAKRLFNLLNCNVNFIGLDPDTKNGHVGKLWTEYKHRIEKKKRKLNGGHRDKMIRWAYLSRQAEKALRLACVYCVSRNIDHLPPVGSAHDALIVNEEDMKFAIARQDLYYEYFEKFLRDWKTLGIKMKEPMTDDAMKELVLAAIDSSDVVIDGHRIASQNFISDVSGMTMNSTFYDLLRTLVLEGKLGLIKGEESRTLVRRMTKEQRKSIKVKIPRGNPPKLYYRKGV